MCECHTCRFGELRFLWVVLDIGLFIICFCVAAEFDGFICRISR